MAAYWAVLTADHWAALSADWMVVWMVVHSAVLTAEKRADEKAVLWAVHLAGSMVGGTEIQKADRWVAWMAAWTDFLMAVRKVVERAARRVA